MESVIVLGLGEVGRPLYGIIRSSGLYRVYGCDIKKMYYLASSEIFQMILIIFM